MNRLIIKEYYFDLKKLPKRKKDKIMELQLIQDKIYVIRGMRVMLDYDLAELYQVETKKLKQVDGRNIKRFPSILCLKLPKTNTVTYRISV